MKKHVALVLALATFGYSASAQTALRIAPGQLGMYPNAVEFVPGQEPEFVRGTVLLKEQNGYARTSDVILKQSDADQIGQEHYRYQQKINNIPVENAIYAVHVAAGKIKSQNGEWVANPSEDLAAKPSISESTALQAAMKAFGAKSYKWQFPAEEAFIKAESGNEAATFLPKAELVYYSGEEEVNASKMRLAYKLDVYAHEPIGRRIYFVDAVTGAILGKREIMHTSNAAGTAVTGYAGTQAITTDSYLGSYRLRETQRGGGIQTFDMNNSNNYSLAVDFVDADNYWNNVNSSKDQYATDAHWGAEMTYDYYKNTFNRNSIDNAGFALKSYVHYGVNYFNAYWDGSRMTYGDGSATNGYRPLVTVDICGHEITHGITSNTANLSYSGESGALNEGFSDIFGTAIEFYAKGSSAADWYIGDNSYAYRSLSNPGAFGQPDTYEGVNWATGSADNGGVHTNSGVINYWFYLLAHGGSGTNDNSYSYSVSSIGMAKAAAIAYRTLTVYLTPTSQYSNACSHSIQAAIDLYGLFSNEVAQVKKAWDAVGVSPYVAQNTCSSDNYESNNSINYGFAVSTNTDIRGLINTSTDKDWFTITTTAAAPKLKVTLEDLGANLDIKLYNAGKSVVGSSVKAALANESIVYNGSNTGATYYVYVYGFNGQYSSNTCYKLRVATSSVNQLVDSESEEENSDQNGVNPMISAQNDQVTVFPNPAKDKLTMSFGADQPGTQNVSITDLMGRIVLSQSFEVLEGMNNISLPLNNYKTGIYFLNVTGKPAVKFIIAE